MLTFCFDEVYHRGSSMVVRHRAENRQRPLIDYWVAMCCWLTPERMSARGASEIGRTERFVYTVELHHDAPQWCALFPGEPLFSPPPEVVGALSEGRCLVVVSFAHEGNDLFSPAMAKGASIFDRLADAAAAHGLEPGQLYFVSADRAAGSAEAAWREARGLAASPFLLRCCEISTFGNGLVVAESLQRGRAPFHRPVLSDDSVNPEPGCRWFESYFGWATSPFTALPPGAPADFPPPVHAFGSLNRQFRPHRWWLLQRLFREGVLDRGLLSFPTVRAEDLASVGCEPIPRDLAPLVERLPLVIDEPITGAGGKAFLTQNSATVVSLPGPVARDCACQIVTETFFSEPYLVVTEKIVKALVGRGPVAVLGPPGTLGYLASIGVSTWGDLVDESYDSISGDVERFESCLRAVLPLLNDPSELHRIERASRERRGANLRWLTEAPKPWDGLLREWEESLAAL